jgi:hypothetical protein
MYYHPYYADVDENEEKIIEDYNSCTICPNDSINIEVIKEMHRKLSSRRIALPHIITAADVDFEWSERPVVDIRTFRPFTWLEEYPQEHLVWRYIKSAHPGLGMNLVTLIGTRLLVDERSAILGNDIVYAMLNKLDNSIDCVMQQYKNDKDRLTTEQFIRKYFSLN